MRIPSFRLPLIVRRRALHKAIWDYIREAGLTREEATAVKETIQTQVENTLSFHVNSIIDARGQTTN